MPTPLEHFTQTAQTAFSYRTLLPAADEQVRSVNWIASRRVGAAVHRQVLRDFLAALRERFGNGFANMTQVSLGEHLRRGRPLTAGMVRRIVAEAEAREVTLIDFASGIRPEQSLYRALADWLLAHPASPPLSEEEIRALEQEIYKSLKNGKPPCNSVEEMAAAVREGRTFPMSGVAEAVNDLIAYYAKPEQLATLWHALNLAGGAADGNLADGGSVDSNSADGAPADGGMPASRPEPTRAEWERLADECRARLFGSVCRGGTALPRLDAAGLTQALQATVADLAARFDALAASGLAVSDREALRQRLFEPEHAAPAGATRLMTAERLEDLIAATQEARAQARQAQAAADQENRAENARLLEALTRRSDDPKKPCLLDKMMDAAISQVFEAVEKRGRLDPLAVSLRQALEAFRNSEPSARRDALAREVRADYVVGGPSPAPRLTEASARQLMERRLAGWQAQLMALSTLFPSPPAKACEALVSSLTADSPGTLLALPPQCLPGFASGDPETMRASAKTLEAQLSNAAMRRNNFGDEPMARMTFIRAALALEVAGMDAVTCAGLYRELDGWVGRGLKANLYREAKHGDVQAVRMEAHGLLNQLALLHRTLGERLGIVRQKESAAFEAYPQVTNADDLPVPFRPAEAPRLGGHLSDAMRAEIGPLHAGDAAVAANLAGRQRAAQLIGPAIAEEFVQQLKPNGHAAFQADLMRGLPVYVAGRRLPCDRANPPAHEAKNAHARLARWLNGFAAPAPEEDITAEFDALSAEKQREVFVVAGLACQTALNAFSTIGASMQAPKLERDETVFAAPFEAANKPQTSSLSLSLSQTGDVRLRVASSHALARISGERQIDLDAQRSQVAYWAEIVIPRAELQRLAALDWSGLAPSSDFPPEYLPRLEVRTLDASLELYPDEA